MNKLQMAHEWVINNMWKDEYKNLTCSEFAAKSFDYADTMQAEADKREKEGKNFDDVLNMANSPQLEWQPDWSQAPDWAEYWYMTRDNKFQWCSKKPYQDVWNWFVDCGFAYTLDVAPSFNYTGDWRNSLRKRPV